MTEPSASPSPLAPPPEKRRGCFGLALKTVLGCCAFAIGSFVAIVLLLPTLCQGWARSFGETIFAETFHGSLKIRELSLSWTRPQTISDAVLLDPEKHEVARVSAQMPSILGLLESKAPWKFKVDVDADLVADDQGAVNLQRAIQPREEKKKTPTDKEASDSTSDLLTRLSTLDAELVVSSRRLSWSDADTRRTGKPFEVRGFSATVRAKPGQPLTAQAKGEVVADVPGALEMDAVLHGPIETGKAWPFGQVDANVRVEGFSTPMVDGIADLGGKLTEVLGPKFDLKIAATGATPEGGEVVLALSSPRSSFDFAGNLEGGLLRSREGSPVRLSLGVPKGFVNGLVGPKLPPGVKIAWEETDKPWTVSFTHLEIPIPDAGGLDAKGIARTLEHLRCDVDVDLPARAGIESDETKAAGVHAAVSGIRASLAAAPGEPAKAHLEASLEAGSAGKIAADASLRDPWQSLASGAMPLFDASVLVQGVPAAAVDAIAGQGGRLAEALGASISATMQVRTADADHANVSATVESPRLKVGLRGATDSAAILRSSGDEGLDLSWDPPAGWIDRQLAPALPAGMQLAVQPGKVEVRVREIVVPQKPTDFQAFEKIAFALVLRAPGATWSGAAPGVAPMSIDPVDVEAKMAAGGELNATLRTALGGGSQGRIALDANGKGHVFDAKLVVDGVATPTLDGFAGQPGFVSGALGPTLSLSLAAHVDGKSVSGKVEATSPTTSLRLSAHLDGQKVLATGDEGLHLSTNPPERWIGERIAPFLPAGASLALTDATKPIEVDLHELTFQLPANGPAPAPAATPAAMLEGLACKLDLKIGGLRYSTTRPNAARTELGLADVALGVEVAGKKPLQAKLSAVVDAGKDLGKGNLAANVSLADPSSLLRADAAKIPAVDADVRLSGIPGSSLDALSGRQGMLSGLFGATVDLAVGAHVASADSGTFTAALTSPNATMSAAGSLDNGMITSGDKPAVDFTATLTQAWVDQQLGPLLPSGAHVALADAKGALHLGAKDLRMPLPSGDVTADALAKASMHVNFAAPDLTYTDAKTADSKASDAKAADSKTADVKTSATVRSLALDADLVPGKAPEMKLAAKIEGTPPGDLDATIRALDPVTDLAKDKGLERYHVAVDLKGKALPTGLVDGLAGQGGLLVDVLGTRFDLALHSDTISQADGNFTASLDSEKASVHCDRGGLQERVLRLEKGQGKEEALLAKAGLTPLFTQKVVGSLVPTLVHLEKPKGSPPVILAVDSLNVPLDADLSKLDAIVRLNLGDVICQPLPGLEKLIGKSGGTTIHMPEIRVPIQKGVASYEGLPFPIGGKTYVFKGTFNLVDKSFKMGTQIPISILGGGIDGKLDSLRGVVDPNTMVPIELKGTWQSPRIGIGDDFLKKLAEAALKKQGGNLLEGLLKKKK